MAASPDLARGSHAWLAGGGARPPIRAALIRFWGHHGVLRLPVPLTGAAALRAGQSAEPALWQPAFPRAIEHEAADDLDLLNAMERAWLAARRAASGQGGAGTPMTRGRSMCWRRRRCSPRPRSRGSSGSR